MSAENVLERDARLPDLAPAEFERIAALLRRETGIDLPPGKRPLVRARLARRLKTLHLSSFNAYCARIEGPDGGAECVELISALTTNVTSFFRESHHFEFIRTELLPTWRRTLKRGGAVRVWSAGCSSGEEPYSLAMLVLDAAPDLAGTDFRILATDIDPVVLSRAVAARYSRDDLAKIPRRLTDLFTRPCPGNDGAAQLDPRLRSLVCVREFNLSTKGPWPGPFDLVLCRNVTIYFDEESKRRVWSRLVDSVAAGGCLIVGHSERLTGEAAARTELCATTTYRRIDAPSGPAGDMPWP